MIKFLKKMWRYFWVIYVKKEVISNKLQKQFGHYGKNTCILNPIICISGQHNMYIADDTKINKYVRLQCYQDDNRDYGKIEIGKKCCIEFRFTVLSGPEGLVKIGDNVLIASDVMISNENHGTDPINELSYSEQPLNVKNVSIGNGCWIGEKVCILPGVSIGEKSIVGAGSVVTRDIPSYSIAVGNPARIIKKYNFEKNRWESVN